MNLLQLKEKAEDKKRIEKRVTKAESELKAEKDKLSDLTRLLKKEYEDVQRLEEGGITTLFYGLLGSKEKKLDKERQEYLAAKLKYDTCKKEIEELTHEIENLKKQLLACGVPDVEYKKQLDEKKRILKESQDVKLMKFEELLGLYYNQKKEVYEAIAAGEKALNGLQNAIKYLRKAQGWGVADMVGGGLLATAIKHSNMDEAKGYIQYVQMWLRKFKRELADINISRFEEMNIQLDGFTSFADYFFDNLIFDWVVQSKINRSLDGCENVYAQVSKIISQLKSTDKNLTEKYLTTKAEFVNYIETSN
ncbi:MAG: hypothetical protein ABFS16_04595 [Bacteroidota bacterium]